MADIPESLDWGIVKGRIGKIITDTVDEGRAPNVADLTVTVTLVPSQRWIRVLGEDGGIFYLDDVVCPVVDGLLVDPETNEPGVSVIAYAQPNAVPNFVQWTATIDAEGVKADLDPVTFNVAGGGVTTNLEEQFGAEGELPYALVVSTEERELAEAAAAKSKQYRDEAAVAMQNAQAAAQLADGSAILGEDGKVREEVLPEELTPAGLSTQIDEAVAAAGPFGFLAQVYAGFNQITYGHSFLAEQGLADVTAHWARRFAAAFGLTYPTSQGGTANDLKRAVGGSEVQDSAARVLNTAPYVPGSGQLVVVENLINTARKNGAVALDLTAARNAMRAMMAALNASAKTEETDAAITYSAGTWTNGTVTTASGGGVKSNSGTGAYFEFTAPLTDAYVLSVARGAGTAGATITITDQNTGTTLDSLDLSNQALGTTGPFAWRIPASARGHVVRFTRTGGTSIYFDALLTQSLTPPPVLWMKEPYLGDYSYSTTFPNGSDAALDAFNALVDEVAAEFPNVIVADPQKAGYWTKAKALPGVDGALVQADGVHPSAEGGQALFLTARDALLAYMTRRAVQVSLVAGTTAGGEVAETFDLRTDPGLVAFYDSASLSALADGAQVATWTPSAGIETVALARSATAERPVMSTGAVYGGKRALLFDGVDDDMAATLAASYSGAQTVLVIGAITNADGCAVSLSGSGVATNLYSEAGTALVAAPGSSGQTLSAAFTPGASYLRLGIVANGATSAMYIDGSKSSGTLGAAVGGNVLRLGETNVATKRLTGGIVALALFERALTDAEVDAAFTQMLA
ncbi:hypothetical protein QWJ90_01225 [Microbacterium oryzae]|uniref:hypothetical protein n=1 Tax=Microbacterium oryzae TaxID=743009 RepID=UPI0025B1E4D0|nr:hypothetical protein [Microbacterium oryzae]MDN3309543.1 hypothetical protein [Microbacterium oryzae]